MNGSSPAPNVQDALPRWIWNEVAMKSSNRCAIRYAAMELTPITTSGNAHLRYPRVSITQQNAASSRKHHRR